MAILGTLIQQSTGSFAASALTNAISYATLVHSLPATNPEAVFPVMVSIEADIAGNGMVGTPHLLGVGGNASVVTVGEAMGTGATTGAVAYKCTSIVFHSAVR